METDHRERTAETIKKAEKDFALDLPLLVDETARDEKILIAITVIKKDQLESIFSIPIAQIAVTLPPDSGCSFTTTKL